MIKYNEDGSLDELSLNEGERCRLKRARHCKQFGKRVYRFSLQRHQRFWWGFLFVVWAIIFPLSINAGCFVHM